MAIVVNGERIEDEAVRQEAERMRPRFEQVFGDEEPQEREAKLQQWARENVVERTLLEQEARRDPEPIPAARVEETLAELAQRFGEAGTYGQLGVPEGDDAAARSAVQLRLRVDRTIERLTEGLCPPSEEAVERYYREHREDFMAPERVRCSHIVKHVDFTVDPEQARGELMRVREELEAGGDFAELAERHSDCPDDGGDLGHFARGQMVEEFEHRVFSMAPGQVSEVFPTRFGFHIVKVHERTPPAPHSLDEVREQVRERLAAEARDKAIEAHLDRLRAEATIEEA
ncbi:MAG: peptidylprolyl isomerase [Candidatus Brocadiia bacterium]